MFLFKKEKIVLTAYTDDPTLLEMFPVVEANKNYPSYYKTLESKYQKLDKRNSRFVENAPEKQSTIRSCYGINNFNNYGFILPVWGEYSIVMDNSNAHAIGSADNRISYHEGEQSAGALDPYHIFKLESPWEFTCNRDIKFLMTQNVFAVNSEYYSITPGITDFYNQTTTNIFLMVNRHQNNKEILIKAGSPLAKFIPLTDEDVELRYEVVDDVKKVKVKPFKYFFHNGLTKMMRAKKTTAEKKQAKCPFHWK